MPGKRGVPLSDDQKALIRAYIDSKKLLNTPREKLAAMILQDLQIEVSGVSAAKIRREAFEDQDTANSCKEAAIREKVLEYVEVEAPKILGYIEDEIKALRDLAYKHDGETPDQVERRENMSIIDRTRISSAIMGGCKSLIEIIGPPKPDRHITTTLEIMETADVSEFMKYGDKDGPDTPDMADSKGGQET